MWGPYFGPPERRRGRTFEVRPLLSANGEYPHFDQSSGTSSNATMLMILISGLMAGPAVSLYGSPTVSPVTAALCASEPLPPKWPSSMYFLALSHRSEERRVGKECRCRWSPSHRLEERSV